MPRQQINLDPYRDDIITLYHHGISSDAISRTLETCHNIQVKERTIQSRLRKWGIRKRHRTTTGDEALHARIKMLFIQDKLTDKAMLNMLQQEGYGISERTLRRLRFKLGLHVRASEQEQHQEQGQMQEQMVVPQRQPEGPTVNLTLRDNTELLPMRLTGDVFMSTPAVMISILHFLGSSPADMCFQGWPLNG
ncbi:unnamed protein product [Penicillium viridicatum]